MARLKITWDEAKRRANLDKHGLDLADVTTAIFDAGLVQVARHGRFKAIGLVEGRPVAMIFKPLKAAGGRMGEALKKVAGL